MISILLLILSILGSVLLLTLLYFLVIHATDDPETEVIPEKKPSFDAEDLLVRSENHSEAQRAIIHCSRYPPQVSVRFKTDGFTECKTLNMVFGGNLSCAGGCLGLGSCSLICPNDAIVFRSGEVYISDACNGCGYCVNACPKKLIELVPISQISTINCAAAGKTDSMSLCPIALDQNRYIIDYRNFPISGFKILHKWGILRKK